MIFKTGRDGTVFTCLAGKKIEDGTGRDEKIMKIIISWTGRDGTVCVKFLDGTGRYSSMTFLFHDGTGMYCKSYLDGTGRQIKIITTGRDVVYFFARRDGTVIFIVLNGTRQFCFYLDGTGRSMIFHAGKGRYFCFFRRDGTVHSCFLDGTGRYVYFSTAQESVMQEHAALGTKAVRSVTSYTYVALYKYHMISCTSYIINGY